MKNKDWGRGREGGLNREGGLINFAQLKRGGLLERGGLFERGWLNRGFTVCYLLQYPPSVYYLFVCFLGKFSDYH